VLGVHHQKSPRISFSSFVLAANVLS
jgi:hypothetical protein